MGYSTQKSHIFDPFPTPTGTSGCLTEFGEDNVPLLSVYGDVHGPCAFCCEYWGFSSVVNPIFLHSFVLIQKEKFYNPDLFFFSLAVNPSPNKIRKTGIRCFRRETPKARPVQVV